MFQMSLPWWEFIVRAAVVYAALLIFVRLSGKRAVGEFTAFDFVVLMLISESAQGALNGGDGSVPGGLVLVATLVTLNYGVGALSARSQRVDRLLEGEPVVLIRNGVIRHAALKRENVPISDLDEAMRRAGLKDCAQVELAMLETNGEITMIKRASEEQDED